MRKIGQVWSACAGNLFEHYDAALFGFLSPFLAPWIFPQSDPMVALILTYAMIPLGMLARPLGALVFGRIGDRRGRKEALFMTLGGMALVSGAIAMTPLYADAGLWTPVIFCIGRLLQNFFSAGESMGGAIFLLEGSDPRRHDVLSSLYNASTIGGILLASAAVAVLAQWDGIAAGWRGLYLLGCITALFGCLIRRAMPEGAPVQRQSFMKVLWLQRTALAQIAIAAGFAYANYMMALVLMNGFIPLITQVTKAQMSAWNTGLLVFDFCALPFFGWLSSQVSRKKVMLGAALCISFCSVPLFTLLDQAALSLILGIRVLFVAVGVAFFAPFHAWAQQLVPKEQRYAVVSFGYALGSQLLGGPTAAVSLWLFQTTGIVASVAWYWVVLAVAAVCVLAKRRVSDECCQ